MSENIQQLNLFNFDKEFEANRPRTPRNMYNAKGRMKDPFHKKGRVIRRGT